jgi:hypothetical protein
MAIRKGPFEVWQRTVVRNGRREPGKALTLASGVGRTKNWRAFIAADALER